MLKKLLSPLGIIVAIVCLGFAIRFAYIQLQTGEGLEAAQTNNQISTKGLFASSFPNELGENKSLKPYAGKIVVLNFWATWCEPCRDEMPELSALHTAYQNQNVVVLGLAIDEVDAIKSFVAETKVSYPLFAAESTGMELATTLGNNKGVLPYTLIIKPDGSIAKTYFGRISTPLLEKTLSTLIQK
jgi:thiol-disulfide isomerase/thioredoxin